MDGRMDGQRSGAAERERFKNQNFNDKARNYDKFIGITGKTPTNLQCILCVLHKVDSQTVVHRGRYLRREDGQTKDLHSIAARAGLANQRVAG